MKEKTKKFWAWFIGIFLICSALTYFNQILIPSLLILMAGIVILPPINKKIKSKFEEKYYSANFGVIRNIIIIMTTLIFVVNVPESNITDQNKNSYKTGESTEEQRIVDEPISKEITETNGTYTGPMTNGKREGKGKYEWNDGCIYEGEFHEDMIHGQGKLIIIGEGTYEGTFSNGKKNGYGKYSFNNDDIYDGNWLDDKMSGKGTYMFANGDTYTGDFSNNQFNGEGTYTNGNNKYTGIWSNNEYKQ